MCPVGTWCISPSDTCSAKDVYAVLGSLWLKPEYVVEAFKARILKLQNFLAKLWTDMEEGEHFITAWLLLGERDRRTHILKGLEEACKGSSLGMDARAMCPDIKISSMLKRKGQAYIDFISSFTKGKNAASENDIYRIPSQWWERRKRSTPCRDLRS